MGRRVARGECPACNKRHRLLVDGTFGSHYVPSAIDGTRVICHGYGDVPIEGTVKWYGDLPEFESEVVRAYESALVGRRLAAVIALGALLGAIAYIAGRVLWG
jgi:hypothetical protein